ncbi:MAG: hypothetical protein WA642_17490 [Steroidobacteraceae bacterium]|jgi:hypothetical protein
MPAEGAHPYYLRSSKTGDRQGYSTLDTAREALLAWVFAQRQAGETVIEQDNGQWSDSRVTMWIADRDDGIVKLRE